MLPVDCGERKVNASFRWSVKVTELIPVNECFHGPSGEARRKEQSPGCRGRHSALSQADRWHLRGQPHKTADDCLWRPLVELDMRQPARVRGRGPILAEIDPRSSMSLLQF